MTIALRTLGDEDRRRVTSWFDRLWNWENDEFVRSRAQRLASDENVYALRTGGDFRIFFSLAENRIVILDIARREALASFNGASGPARS